MKGADSPERRLKIATKPLPVPRIGAGKSSGVYESAPSQPLISQYLLLKPSRDLLTKDSINDVLPKGNGTGETQNGGRTVSSGVQKQEYPREYTRNDTHTFPADSSNVDR